MCVALLLTATIKFMEYITLSAFIVAITQVAKMTFGLTRRYIPITSLLISFALICAFAFYSNVSLTWEMVANAMIAGLTACGLWSGIKATTE